MDDCLKALGEAENRTDRALSLILFSDGSGTLVEQQSDIKDCLCCSALVQVHLATFDTVQEAITLLNNL